MKDLKNDNVKPHSGPSEFIRNVHSPEQLRRLSRLDCWSRISYLRKLTREFLTTEMHRDFITEGVLFAVIVVISVWPMISLVERMARTFP